MRPQRFLIVKENPKDSVRVIGTTTGQLMGESSAKRNATLLKEANPDCDFTVVEITCLLDAL